MSIGDAVPDERWERETNEFVEWLKARGETETDEMDYIFNRPFRAVNLLGKIKAAGGELIIKGDKVIAIKFN